MKVKCEGGVTYIVSEESGVELAEMILGGTTLARQFSAVPELLSFAKRFLYLSNEDALSPEDECYELPAQARAAINKAEGKSDAD